MIEIKYADHVQIERIRRYLRIKAFCEAKGWRIAHPFIRLLEYQIKKVDSIYFKPRVKEELKLNPINFSLIYNGISPNYLMFKTLSKIR
jgi:DNA-directed RNA polymerase subunit L